MHFIDRGEEPATLAKIRDRYTSAWVRCYREKKGRKPTDTKWRSFEPVLRARFHSLCAYCEETSKGEVDHFRPKRTFPEQVYFWTNWVYSCHVCNNLKRERWIVGGYVDPCDGIPDRRAERFFDFDTTTGEIIARRALSRAKFRRALAMRDDLQLNAYFRLKARVWYIKVVQRALEARVPDSERKAFIADITARDARFSSLIRKLLTELAIPFP